MTDTYDEKDVRIDDSNEEGRPEDEQEVTGMKRFRANLSRNTYTGALLFNIFAFFLPALYDTLVKLWISKIDTSLVATTDSYTYISIIVEVLNEGLPKAAYLIIGNASRPLRERLQLSFTLVAFQAFAGLIMSVAFLGAAPQLASAFVPENVRDASITYIRLSSFQALTSAIDTAVSLSTRALDRPDVPLAISLARTAANIILDFMFLSTFRIRTVNPPTINTQATIRLCCNIIGSLAGLIYFGVRSRRLLLRERDSAPGQTATTSVRPTISAWLTLAKPGSSTFAESAVRNAFYLWLIHGIVALGSDYATAWGIFNTIRWGLVMVPVNALEATSSTFVGHEWGAFWARQVEGGKATWSDLIGPRNISLRRAARGIMRPALRSTLIAILIELPLLLFFSLWLVYPFAVYLSSNPAVAEITTRMWRTLDWCYIFYAINTMLASVLLATRPRWYLVNSALVNILWVLPWCIALQVGIPITESTAWTYHAIIFGGSLVLSFFVTLTTLAIWISRMRSGKINHS